MNQLNYNKKAGISLTTSYIVIIIMVLALIGVASKLVITGLDGARTGVENIDIAQQRQVEENLKLSNANIDLPFSTNKMNSGGSHTFVMGVKNNLGKRADFTVQIVYDSAQDPSGKKMLDPSNIGKWYILEPVELNLDSNEVDVIGLPFKAVKARPGGYNFNILVDCELDSCKPHYAVKGVSLVIE